jgi:phosphoribosylformylglycinamidine synthase
VSFYNETLGKGIYPTPMVGMLGVMEDVSKATTPGFKAPGDTIILLGRTLEELGGSEYLKVVHGRVAGTPPEIDLDLEASVQAVCLRAIDDGLIRSAHDCSEGGLAVALAECCFFAEPGAKGASVSLERGMRADALLFSESQSRILISCVPENMARVLEVAADKGAPAFVIGAVSDGTLTVSLTGTGAEPAKTLIEARVGALEKQWREVLAWSLR